MIGPKIDDGAFRTHTASGSAMGAQAVDTIGRSGTFRIALDRLKVFSPPC